MVDFAARLKRVQRAMIEHSIDLMFLPPSANLHYVTGIVREEQNYGNTMYPGDWMTGAWITQGGAPVLTVPRMMADFHGSFTGFDLRVLPDTGDALGMVCDVLDGLNVAERAVVALEDRARAETMMKLHSLRPKAQFASASTLMVPLRMIKDASELEVLHQAGSIVEAAYQAALGKLRHGMTTLDLITELNHQLRLHGSLAPPFVTSFYNMGPKFPFNFHNHEEVLLIPLEPPVSVSFDFGAVLDGYCYDYGRSVFFGQPDAAYQRVYRLVMESQAAGTVALKAGNTCAQADHAARSLIENAGHGAAFRHRLGHGIGMDVHEQPFLNANDKTVMQSGMCFTVEPSIFVPGQFGARVEDIVVVGPDGGQPLTSGFQALHVVD
jgi:Xaa-Pro aminopeptidase